MSRPAAAIPNLPLQVRSGLKDTDPVWTTAEATQDFEFVSFIAPFVEVVRRADGAKGSLQFCSNPRFYFAFVEDSA